MSFEITTIEPIEWRVYTPEPGAFPCYVCHGVNGNATFFASVKMTGEHEHETKLPVCEKCAEYARIYPTWLEEMLFTRRMEAAAVRMATEQRAAE
jgi:hypothetical protein